MLGSTEYSTLLRHCTSATGRPHYTNAIGQCLVRRRILRRIAAGRVGCRPIENKGIGNLCMMLKKMLTHPIERIFIWCWQPPNRKQRNWESLYGAERNSDPPNLKNLYIYSQECRPIENKGIGNLCGCWRKCLPAQSKESFFGTDSKKCRPIENKGIGNLCVVLKEMLTHPIQRIFFWYWQ